MSEEILLAGSPLVGREQIRKVMAEALEAAVSGAGGCLIMEGPAGIGKTRMLSLAADRAREMGLAVAASQAVELDRVAPLTVLLSALRRSQPPVLAELSRGDLAGHEDSRFWLVDRLAEQIESYSRARPLLIALDDLQWADELTALALRILVPLLRSTPVCWLLAHRPLSAQQPARQAVDRLLFEGAVRVPLAPLSADESGQLCAHLLGAAPGPSVRALISASGGNPFLLEELLITLGDAGRLRVADGQAVADEGQLPTGFVAAVDQRMRDLSAPARRLLEAGAVLGRPFTLHEAAGVLDQRVVDLLGVTQELRDAGAVVEQGSSLRFRHDLIREAVYNGMPGAVRQALHREAAGVLRAEGRPAAEVANHLVCGARPGDPETVAVLDQAVAEVAPTAPGAGAEMILRVLDLLERSDPHRPRLVAAAVRLLASAGRVVEARQLGEATLREQLASADEASVLLGLAEALKHAGQDRAAVDYSRRALEHSDVPPVARAQLLAVQAHALMMVDDLAQAERIGAQAVAAGREAGQQSAVVFGTVIHSIAVQSRGDLDTALELAGQARDLADQAGGESRHRHPRLWLGRLLVAADRFEEAESVLAADKREIEQLGTGWSRPLWHHFRTELLLATGALDDAEAEAETGLRVAEQFGVLALVPPLLATLGYLALRRDDPDAALDYLRRAQHQVHGGTGVISEEMQWELADYYADMGRSKQAMDMCKGFLDALPERMLLLVQEPLAMPSLVRIAIDAGEPARAQAVVEAGATVAGRNPTVASLVGAAAHANGLLRRDRAQLREAVAILRTGPRPFCLASALEDLGSLELADGERAVAVELLEEALRCYAGCGAKRDAARVRRRLREVGVRRTGALSHRRARTGWSSLTESELRVARLVAQALTTREIADQLYLSRHTVDSHIRHAFAKLGVSSRVELTRHVLQYDQPPGQ